MFESNVLFFFTYLHNVFNQKKNPPNLNSNVFLSFWVNNHNTVNTYFRLLAQYDWMKC